MELNSRFLRPARSIFVGGAISGLLAGAVMILTVSLLIFLMYGDFTLLLKAIAATAFGPLALMGGPQSVLTGFLIHAIISAIFGMAFSFITQSISAWQSSFWIGACFGIAVWALITYVGAPLFNPFVQRIAETVPATWFISFLMAGASLALTPYFESKTTPAARKRRKEAATFPQLADV